MNRFFYSVLQALTVCLATALIGCDGGGAKDKGSDAGTDKDGDSNGDSDGRVDDDTGTGEAECGGEEGCPCGSDEDCIGALVCVGDVCQAEEAPLDSEPECEPGSEGCACANGDRCAKDSNGEALECVAGTCVAGHCLEAGESGCPCKEDGSCNMDGDVCEDGVCVADNCIPGEENCECLGGGCDPGLMCRDNTVCVDNAGYEGGVCLENGVCHIGNFCDAAQDRCIHCELGTEGCHCKETGTCNEGLRCQSGICLSGADISPENPKCYYPCESDLITDGELISACDADGLMEGCLEEQTCEDGSCLNEGEEKPTCQKDSECPFFQVCLQGGCYSNCEVHTDCAPGLGCYKKACRVPCQSTPGSAPCESGYNCETSDGENGYCTPMAAQASQMEHQNPSGGMELEKNEISFSNIKTSDMFGITPIGERSQIFTIKKVSHIIYTEDGDMEIAELPRDPVTEEYVDEFDCDPAQGECPLWWLGMAFDEDPTQAPSLTIEALPSCGDRCPVISLSNAGNAPGVRWTGILEVATKDGRARDYITLNYVERPEGQWIGTMYYFGNFSDNGLAAWEARADRSDVDGVDNGLIQLWGAFLNGRLDGFEEFRAVLTATRTESWKFKEVEKRCTELNGADAKAACYPYTNPAGIRTYVFDTDHNFIPSGLSDMPMAVNLRLTGETSLAGRIESSVAMHYAGNPAITLEFVANPADASACDENLESECIVYIDDMVAEINVGGRFIGDIAEDCGAGYERQIIPWLVPGFTNRTFDDTEGAYQYHCLDKELPHDTTVDDSLIPRNLSLAWGNPVPDGRPMQRTLRIIDGALVNQKEMFILFEESFDSFAQDGGEAVSAYGYMLLKRQPTDLDPADDNSDGIIDAFQGAVPPETTQKVIPPREGLKCDLDFVAEIVDNADDLTDLTDWLADDPSADTNRLDALVETLLEGVSPDSAVEVFNSDREDPGVAVNYYCHDTGMFNAGPNDYPGSVGARYPCPAGSKVDFFVVTDPADLTQQIIAETGCQDEDALECVTFGCPTCEEAGCDNGDGVFDQFEQACVDRTHCDDPALCKPRVECSLPEGQGCFKQLTSWRETGRVEDIDFPLHWECEDPSQAYCDLGYEGDDEDAYRLDLRAGRRFFGTGNDDSGLKVMMNLQAAIDEAFRYKTRFVSRSGTVLGFAPVECIPNSDEIRYCYDPPAIEEIIQRIDCLMEIYTNSNLYAKLDESETAPDDSGKYTKDKLDDFLRGSYSEFDFRKDGFERLYSELLIMMGDEALTAAFASRFDLAGMNTRSFEGAKFESDGINLSGVAGAEMYNLHQAIQYYQMALDRLYEAGPNLEEALVREESTDSPTNFISPETVTLYLERLIRASTQKCRVYSEIAKSYQNFNVPDLARRVIERAFTSAYLESVIIRELTNDIAEKSERADRPQITKIIEDAHRRYRMAMLDMRDVYSSITDNVNYFGFAPDYIPFPTVDTNKTASTSAFEVLLATSKQKVAFAKQRELQALQSNRNVNTDAETFQAELVRIRNTYENQLADICGTFKVTDDNGEEQVYPAIRKYASLHNVARILGDPCGRMGNGAIFNAMVAEEQSLLQDRMVRVKFDNKLANIENERQLVADQCGLTLDQAQFVYNKQGQIITMQTDLRTAKVAVDATCGYLESAASAVKAGIYAGAAIAAGSALDAGDAISNTAQAAEHATDAVTTTLTTTAQMVYGIHEKNVLTQISETERETAKWVTERQCEAAVINSNARTADMLLELKEIQLELLQAVRDSGQRLSEIGRLYNKAKRLQDEQADAEQLLINVQAARNDPNVRIYRNDAIINADIAFDDALRSVYRATKVFEYYTSQSYARLEQLFLIRMVQAGDYNLENYLLQLENEFYEFEEEFGLPDVRVAMLSLRDDIMAIPNTDGNNNVLSRDSRINEMRSRLASVEMLDANGYLSIPFSTSLDNLSPLTRNHKIYYIEADIVGSEVGDTIGRLYLRQSGTGVVHNVQDEKDYYVFPEKTAVINPFFNGNRVFTTEIYRSNRLRDRPMVNTGWELLINQRDEMVNKDIDLQTLSDIRLYIYYTDFTVF